MGRYLKIVQLNLQKKQVLLAQISLVVVLINHETVDVTVSFSIAPVLFWIVTLKWTYYLLADGFGLMWFWFRNILVVCADVFDTPVSCAKCMRDFWRECLTLAPVMSFFSSVSCVVICCCYLIFLLNSDTVIYIGLPNFF